jgi:hypothetical protein
MKGVLSDVISGQQSAFVPGRLIIYNILLLMNVFMPLKGRKENMGCVQ